ncbi:MULTISPECIES: alpha/beta fold hydrolase [Bacteria]|uniref:alpha/beta fold hydrolase n=1 Tax=Bacteria TaxID=2 RepID=UPI003C7EB968
MGHRSSSLLVRLALGGGAVAALLGLSGCAGSVWPTGSTDSAVVTSSAADSWVGAWAEKERGASLGWEPCDDDEEMSCARMRVPVDWSSPEGATIEVPVRMKRSATPDAPLLFLLDGGPGGDGAGFLSSVVGGDKNRQVQAAFSAASLTPRGVYGVDLGPEPLDCPEWSIACEESDTLLRYASTADLAMDYEYLRRLTGGQPFRAVGASYGTYVGAVYVSLFPQHAQRMVFDGAAVDYSFAPLGWERQSLALEDALDRFLARCVNGELGPCPFSGDPAEAKERLIALRVDLGTRPLEDGAGSSDSPVTAFTLTNEVMSALYGGESEWPDAAARLGEVVAAVEQATSDAAATPAPRRGTGSASAKGQGAKSEDEGMSVPHRLSNAVFCAMPNTSGLAARPSIAPLPDDDLFFGQDSGGFVEDAVHVLGCAGDRPVHRDPQISYDGEERFLVTSVTGDPATPFSDAASLADALHAVLLPVDGEGHVSVFSRSQCSTAIAVDYLRTGATPGEEVRCATDR